MHAATTAYNAWDYPIYQKSVSEQPIGQVCIIVPQVENALTLIPVTDKDFAYDQDYEVGMILSYMSAAKPGYSQEGLLFHPVSLPVMGDPSSSTTLSYNSSNTTMTSDSTTQDVSVNAGKDTVEALALAEPNVQKFMEGLTVRKVIVVPGKIVNIVAG